MGLEGETALLHEAADLPCPCLFQTFLVQQAVAIWQDVRTVA